MADDISSIIGAAASQYANDLEYTPLRHRLAPHLAGQARPRRVCALCYRSRGSDRGAREFRMGDGVNDPMACGDYQGQEV
jgi:hypothetical protein